MKGCRAIHQRNQSQPCPLIDWLGSSPLTEPDRNILHSIWPLNVFFLITLKNLWNVFAPANEGGNTFLPLSQSDIRNRSLRFFNRTCSAEQWKHYTLECYPEKWYKVGRRVTVWWHLRADCWTISVILMFRCWIYDTGDWSSSSLWPRHVQTNRFSLFLMEYNIWKVLFQSEKLWRVWIAVTSSLVKYYCLQYKSHNGVRWEQWQGFDFAEKRQILTVNYLYFFPLQM